MNKIYNILLMSFLFVSCSSRPIFMNEVSERIVSRVDTIKVVPPVIERFVYVSYKDTSQIVAKDTNIVIKYYPLEKRFYVKLKPDTVKIIKIHTDTIKTTINQKKYTANTEYMPYVAFGCLVLFAIFFLLDKIKLIK